VPWDEQSAKQFGSAVRRLREERGISQETLAFQAGITKNQIQLIEAGRRSGRKEDAGHSNPRMSTLVGIADVLQISSADLLFQANNPATPDVAA